MVKASFKMAPRVILGALVRRRSRTAVALLSVVVGASVAGAMASVIRDADRKVSEQLRGYGPNLLIVPRDSATLPEAIAHVRVPGLTSAIPALYQVGEMFHPGDAPQPVVLVGTFLTEAAHANPWWHIQGKVPVTTTDCLVGSKVGRMLGVMVGDHVAVTVKGHSMALTVAGVLDAHGDEDSQVLLHLPMLQRTVGLDGRVSVVSAVAEGDLSRVQAVGREVTKTYPEAEARPVLAIASSQGRVFGKLQRLMALVTMVIIACSALCTGATLIAAAAEREREFGLMKALGASRRRLASLLLGEAIALGAMGGLLGYGVGLGFAQWIGRSLEAGWVKPNLPGFGAALGTALLLTLGSGGLALIQALSVDPIVTLKGE